MDDKLKVTDDGIQMIIKFYCYEAGVKKLEEYLENIYLVAKKRLERGKVKEPLVVNEGILENIFGPKLFNKLPYDDGKTQPGMIMGLLSSFSLGGSSDYIEADINIGSVEKLKIVGVSDNGVKESIEIAYEVAKNVLKRHDPENNFFDQFNVIVQFEFEGTGNSAGTSFVSVFLSLALNLPIRGIAMSGSISVRGRVLAVGGIKDKLDAAKRVGIPLVILPEDNREDYDELEEFIKEGIHVEFASDYDQIFRRIFPDFKPKKAKKMDSSNVAQFYE